MDKKILRLLDKRKIANISLIVSVFLVVVKTAVAYASNSLGVFSEALNNGLDLVTVLITFFAVRLAERPADKDHTYGHGKYENFSGLIETLIISSLSAFIIYRSIQRLLYRNFELNINWIVFTVLGISVLLNILRVIFIRELIKKKESYAFRAEFINYSGDIAASFIVIIGLIFAKFGIFIADPIASIIVSLVVITLSGKLSFSIIRNLLDYVPKEVTGRISGIIEKIPDIKGINDLKVHEVGGIKFINLDISISNNLYLTQVEKIKAKTKKKIKADFKDSEIIIEVKPSISKDNLPDHIKSCLMDKNEIKEIYNIYTYDVGNKLDISVNVKLKDFLKLDEIETLTKKVEKELKNKIGNLRRVYIHTEDLGSKGKWDDITGSSGELIEEIKSKMPPGISPESCHNFSILRKKNSYHVAFHCRLNKNMAISDAHKIITSTEDRIKSEIEKIDEVLIHIEPGR